MKWIQFFLSLTLILSACANDNGSTITSSPTAEDWLIPRDEIFDGGPGKDGIPSIDNPQFTKASEISFLDAGDLVLGIKVGDVVKAYPHPVMDWHEIVNDKIGNLNIALTYCPLTGTGIGWNRFINGEVTTFGVSGLLYNTNLMPYDRLTNSTWSQQGLKCVNGALIGTKSENISFIETNFETWIKAYPNSEVMNTNTGFQRNYSRYPYGKYRTNNNILFPVTVDDTRLPKKERTLAIFLGDEPTAFTFNKSGEGINIFNQDLKGKKITIAVSADDNIIMAFINDKNLNLQPVKNDLPILMKDSKGNRYDIFGKIVQGPDSGTKLELPTQFIGYWFSWASFYKNLDLVVLK